MEEKQNEEKVTLDNILDEIKSMREEAEMQHKEAKIQHKQASIISGIGVAGAICFLGGSTLITTKLSADWQLSDSLSIMLLGVVLLICFMVMWRKLGKELRELHKETKND